MSSFATGPGLLSLTIFLPAITAILLLFIPKVYDNAVKGVAILSSIATFLLSLGVFGGFTGKTFHFQMVEAATWLPQIGATYRVGLDGISIWLFLLGTMLTVICAIFSLYIKDRVREYFICMLVLETAMLGVFCSMDMLLFYSFFEVSLIPMALMIWIWGGKNRNYAAGKFFLYTFAASVFMLIGMIALANLNAKVSGQFTFDMVAIQANVANGKLWAGAAQAQVLIFWSFALAFMVKCPMFPFHTWLPDAHTEAPTAGSVLLAGVLLKMGTFGFLRFLLPFFPDVVFGSIKAMPAFGPFPALNAVQIMMTLATIGILYGAIVAAIQPDVKKLVAYSSVAHMGFVVYGIFSLNHTGLMGGAYQQLNHGISTGALFLLIGLLYERIHTRLFADMGGLKSQMPIFAGLFLIMMLSSVGLPGLNGFVGEFLAMLGAFQTAYSGSFGLTAAFPILAGIGVILAAVYLLWMFQKVFYGPVTNEAISRLKDLKPWEAGLVLVFVVFAFWGGIYPNTFLKPMEASVNAARMMAINPALMRPAWNDKTLEIDERGNLVRVAPRSDLDDFVTVQVVSPNWHHAQQAASKSVLKDNKAPKPVEVAH